MTKRLLFSLPPLALLATDAWAKHLLHEVPAAIGEAAMNACSNHDNSAFGKGWCIDKKLQEWLEKLHKTGKTPVPPAGDGEDAPMIKTPNILIDPKQ